MVAFFYCKPDLILFLLILLSCLALSSHCRLKKYLTFIMIADHTVSHGNLAFKAQARNVKTKLNKFNCKTSHANCCLFTSVCLCAYCILHMSAHCFLLTQVCMFLCFKVTKVAWAGSDPITPPPPY